MNKENSKSALFIELVIAYLGAMIGTALILLFNQNVIGYLPIKLRMLCMVILYWLIALIPGIVMKLSKDNLHSYGFSNTGIRKQAILGIVAASAMSLILTLLPHVLGMGEFVDNGSRYKYFWQYLFEFAYCIVSVGVVEEFVFRGVIYYKIKQIFSSERMPIVLSSILFGLFHIFTGNLIQIIVTSFLGIVFCLLRLKIKEFTTLSLIITHGVYDALISVWASTLL